MKHVISALAGAFISVNSFAIPEIVVTTDSGAEQNIDDTVTTVEIINRDKIEEIQAQTAADILGASAGFDIGSLGGKGKTTTTFLRGASNKQTLVLINGIRASSATDGFFAWESLDPELIEKIEITRGSRSSLYGSEAIGGVVQIFTRKHNGYVVKLGGGSFNSHRQSVSLGKNAKNFGLGLSLNRDESAGFSATNSNNPNFNSDKDSSGNRGAVLTAWYKIGQGLKVSFDYLAAETQADFDEIGVENSKLMLDNHTGNIKVEHKINNHWQQSITLGHSRYEYRQRNDNDKDGEYNFHTKTGRKQINWMHEAVFGNLKVAGGADYYKEKIDYAAKFDGFAGKKISNNGMFVNFNSSAGKFKYGLGVRGDDHKFFGSHNTWNTDAGIKLSKKWLLFANYGTSFRAPTAYELFSVYGNQRLQPEDGRSVETSLKYFGADGGLAQISIYDAEIARLIDYDFSTEKYFNADKAKIRGLEVEWEQNIREFVWGGALTFMDARDGNGNKLIRRPDEKLTLNLTRHFAKGYARLSSLSVGKRSDGFDGGTKLPGYTVVNLSGKYKFTPHIAALLKVENLTDRKYEVISGYNTPERSFYITLEYSGMF